MDLVKLGTFKSNDGTIKCVFKNAEDEIVEISLLANKKYDVVVVPSHHYCNLSCKMCHLTSCNINKKMTPVKVEELLTAITETVTLNNKKRTNKKGLLISFMGVGDPLLNFDLVTDTYINEDLIKQVGYTDISYAISTMMPIDNLANVINKVETLKMPLKIHYSMHSSHDYIRKQLIPASKMNVDPALFELYKYRSMVRNNKDILKKYTKFHRTDDPTEVHYTLIKDENDSAFELANLIYVLDKYQIPIKFLRFNPKDKLESSTKQQVWIDTIKEYIPDLRVKEYCPPGKEIGSSCGEFTRHYYLEEIETEEDKKEFDEWYNKYLVKELKPKH